MPFKGKNRKKYAMSSVIFQNAALKLINLAMEVTMLRQLLQSGSLAVLTYGFACFLAVNSPSCVVIVTGMFSVLTEIPCRFVGSFTFSNVTNSFGTHLCGIHSALTYQQVVFFPTVTLIYCYYHFNFDRESA
ncbi:Hypothetical protein PHPALM_1311 [Phytophthora palmivora]|uniref:Uncharacterized protein n=1 Tax=Phytophthora palmivora TaxID=4796 RepID=A0A2P4YSM7_9STRA|nr:Hypothetical protein PHPALM_1311 [Phytophthora palmivora]